MWKFERRIKLRQSHANTSISSLYARGSSIYVGVSDGRVVTERYELQSHEREFDYLESSDISEKVNALVVFSQGTFHEWMATCNEKSIKLWRIRPHLCTHGVLEMGYHHRKDVFLLKEEKVSPEDSAEVEYRFECMQNLRNVHSYSINSLSVSTNEHLLLSSDYLRIHLWCTQKMSQCFNLVDTKPKRYEELEFVITKCLFRDNTVFGYGTTHGVVYVNDLRISPRSMRVNSVSANKSSFYDDLTRAISDFRFLGDDRLVTRDLNSVNVYDLRNTQTELKRYALFETQESFLEGILTRDTEGDTFSLGMWNGQVVTGGYGAEAYVISLSDEKIEKIGLGTDAYDRAVEHCLAGDGWFAFSCGDECHVYRSASDQ